MIEKTYNDYLKQKNVASFLQEPDSNVSEYVLPMLAGGSESDFVRHAKMVFRSYGKTKYEAAKLHEKVIKIVKGSVELDTISSAKLNSEGYAPDPETKRPRYQAYFDIYYKE